MMKGVLAASAVALACAPAMATVVLSTYETSVAQLNDYAGAYGDLSIGDRVTLIFRYDSSVNREEAHDLPQEFYHFGSGALSPMTVTANINGANMSIAPTLQGSLDIGHDFPLGLGLGDAWVASIADTSVESGVETLQTWTGIAVDDHLIDSLDPATNFVFLPNSDSRQFSTLSFVRRRVDGSGASQQQVALLLDKLSVVIVPEPATWALMIAGFGLAGAALRRMARPDWRLSTQTRSCPAASR